MSAGCVMPADAITYRRSRRACGVNAIAEARRSSAAGLRAAGVILRFRVLRLQIHKSRQPYRGEAVCHETLRPRVASPAGRAEFGEDRPFRVGKSSDRSLLQ